MIQITQSSPAVCDLVFHPCSQAFCTYDPMRRHRHGRRSVYTDHFCPRSGHHVWQYFSGAPLAYASPALFTILSYGIVCSPPVTHAPLMASFMAAGVDRAMVASAYILFGSVIAWLLRV